MASPYDKLVELIKTLDINDDGIAMNHKIKIIEQNFCNIVLNEDMLNESMEYMNDAVLKDSEDTAQKFAILISSRNFDFFAIDKTTIRYKMISLLQKNFLNADEYRKNNDKIMLYNSITLLGEYYNRIRQSDGKLMSNLGSALLDMLTQELATENETDVFHISKTIDVKLAKLILSQITLNGELFQLAHKDELNLLLYHIRRVLIEYSHLKSCVKALLIMSLDLFYNNFRNLGTKLEEMYTKHLIDAENYCKNNKIYKENNDDEDDEIKTILSPRNIGSESQEDNNLQEEEEVEEEIEIGPQKKWSEQVDEEENELLNNQLQTNGYFIENFNNLQLDLKNIYDDEENYNNRINSPSNYNDDQQSVRSEGGSLKLYNVKDRLRNIHRNYNNNQGRNSTSPTNKRIPIQPKPWNGKYHSFDRSRRRNTTNSSANNYENNTNNSHYNNSRNLSSPFNHHNRPQYDRPPRFSKFHQKPFNPDAVAWRNFNHDRPNFRNPRGHPDSYHHDSRRGRPSDPRVYSNFNSSRFQKYHRGDREGSFDHYNTHDHPDNNFDNQDSTISLKQDQSHGGSHERSHGASHGGSHSGSHGGSDGGEWVVVGRGGRFRQSSLDKSNEHGQNESGRRGGRFNRHRNWSKTRYGGSQTSIGSGSDKGTENRIPLERPRRHNGGGRFYSYSARTTPVSTASPNPYFRKDNINNDGHDGRQ